MQVLVVLADAGGQVITRGTLFDRCWGGVYVGDDSLNRTIAAIRKLASEIAGGSFEIETIPRTGYRLTSSAIDEHDPSEKSAKQQGHRFRPGALVAAAALAALALAGAIFWIDYGTPPASHPISVTVLPFQPLNASQPVHSLAQRIPNEIVDALGDSQIPAVLAAEQASGTSPRATLMVTGFLREDAVNTAVDVRIEDGATHDALWSTEFKRESRESSDLPEEVAARVADVVNMAIFARSAHPPLTDDSALSALLQTTDMIRDPGEGAWAKMINLAQSIVARHPDFAFGHSLLAAAYAQASEDIAVPDRARAMSEAAKREASLTLKLDPQDAGAYVVLSDLEPIYDYRAQEEILLRGIKFARHPKEPVGALYQYQGGLLDDVGRLREGLPYQLVAQATDQWSPSKTSRLAFVYANIGNLAAARDLLQKAMERWPNHSGVLDYQRYVAGFYEKPPEALAVFDRLDAHATSGREQNAIWRTFVEAKAAHSERETATAIERIRESADQHKISRETEIMMIAGLGETKQAIEAANLALDQQQLEPRFLFTPVMRDVRRDPGFVRLASRMGHIRYWRESGKRPDFCTDALSRDECSPELLAALKS